MGLAGRGGEARGWTWADPRCPGRGLGSRGWPRTRGRCWEAGSRSAATRATAASMRACACSKRGRAAVLSVCPPLSPSVREPESRSGRGGDLSPPPRGVREQPGGSPAPRVTVGSWWELLRLEPQDFKGPVSVVFTFRILAKLGEGTILPLTPSHRGRAGERVSKCRSGAEGAKTLLREVKLLLGTWVQIPLFIRNWRSTFEGHWSQDQAFLQVSEVHGMGWKFKQLLNPLTENSLSSRTSFTLHIDAVVPLWSLVLLGSIH